MTEHIEAFVASAAEALGGDRERPMVAVSALVGAVALSRVIADPARWDAGERQIQHTSRTPAAARWPRW